MFPKKSLQAALKELSLLVAREPTGYVFRKEATRILGKLVKDSPTPLGAVVPGNPDFLAALSARERDVLKHLVRGLTNAEIAHKLGTSAHTTRNQISTLYKKLGVSSRAACVRVAFQSKLVGH